MAHQQTVRAAVDVVHEAALAAPPSLSHVFTNWLPEDPENAALVERLRELARRRGARFVPVWMSASVEALTARVSSPGRAERSKLVDPEVLRRLLERPELPAPTDALSVDMSETTPAQAAERILASLGTGTSAIAQP